MTKFFDNNESFEFETLRAVGYADYSGATYGEVNKITQNIDPNSTESWCKEWINMADKINKLAYNSANHNHRRSAFETFLRASNYYRSSEFFLDPNDKRRIDIYHKSVNSFKLAMKYSNYDVMSVEIPFKDYYMNGYFYKAKKINAPTLIYIGGYDSICEELYYTGGAAAVDRGYNVLIFDGPGQGVVLRINKKKSIPNYEAPVGAAIDYLDQNTQIDVNQDFIALMGMSLGGNYVSRAAAFEQRINAVIMYDVFTDPLGSFIEKNPNMKYLMKMPDDEAQKTLSKLPRLLQWEVNNCLWVFGGKTIAESLKRVEKFDVSPIVNKIKIPSLLLFGVNDIFVNRNQLKLQEENMRKEYYQTHIFYGTFGAENHCQVGNMAILVQTVFDWLVDVING